MSIENSINFTGFEHKAIEFLASIKENNNKQWFENNRQIYNHYIVRPLQCLIAELSPVLMSIDPLIETTPAIGKTISRINRDTRFSNDKSPYRNNVWVTFKRSAKEWQDSPGFFFELSASSYRYGMGFYSANRKTMDKFREAIDSNFDEFRRAISFYNKQQTFNIEGDKYKRIIDASKSAEILDWYQRKNLYLACNRQIDNRLFSGQLLGDLITGFSQVADFYHYLYRVKTITNKE